MTIQPEINKKTVNNEEEVFVDDPAALAPENPEGSYEGRKNDPDIKGPQQKSQETDEIYADPRKDEDIPDGGKNVGDLSAFNLSQEGNDI
ncbi:hypothetical protein ES754_05615 [Psychrobacter frigidicola]|uniref:Uncharacterized protein n=1 Tax=Psychrobacter frigidicola TaxID=45611 RepID=A0A5C7A6S4_9GAMM|nr:hypothetical protein [Psychrobacter frigidicola]TXD98395.1 hypothetical protein ES754_05615 [Psychrobacter frigidicola]